LLFAALMAAPASAAPPDNDDFADARPLIPGIATTGSTAEATIEEGEPWHSTAGDGPGDSVWFRWRADATGTARIDACASTFDTEVAVYAGAALDATLYSTRVADDAGGCSGHDSGSYVVFRAVAGQSRRLTLRVGPRTRRAICSSRRVTMRVTATGGDTEVRRRSRVTCR